MNIEGLIYIEKKGKRTYVVRFDSLVLGQTQAIMEHSFIKQLTREKPHYLSFRNDTSIVIDVHCGDNQFSLDLTSRLHHLN